MATIGWWDRLRIERLVWMLDQQLYDLPRRARIDTRREVRANLLDAARDVGTTAALHRVGGSTRLAEQYRDAALGDGPHHSWVAAVTVLGLLPLLFNYVFGEAAATFRAGLLAADPHATGTFSGPGISHLQNAITYAVTDGTATQIGGGWTPWAYAVWLLAAVAAGRLWRLLRRTPVTAN